MNVSEAARRLAARRPVQRFTCLWCGREFDALGTARYCSQSCRSAAWKQRRRETDVERVLRETRALLRGLPDERRDLALRVIRSEDFLDELEDA